MVASALQVVGLIILALSVGLVSVTAGGIILGLGCLLFGVALERR